MALSLVHCHFCVKECNEIEGFSRFLNVFSVMRKMSIRDKRWSFANFIGESSFVPTLMIVVRQPKIYRRTLDRVTCPLSSFFSLLQTYHSHTRLAVSQGSCAVNARKQLTPRFVHPADQHWITKLSRHFWTNYCSDMNHKQLFFLHNY